MTEQVNRVNTIIKKTFKMQHAKQSFPTKVRVQVLYAFNKPTLKCLNVLSSDLTVVRASNGNFDNLSIWV